MCVMNNNNNNNSNHCNEKRKLNSIFLISLSVSIFLIIITFLSIDEEKNTFNLSLGQEIKLLNIVYLHLLL